ncbi:L-lactate dehydrogenase [Anaerobranca californiensis DSM 14826]|jgi:L-lactate dehydrogenase|uniref:L-lactate dehydrogenase n=1 Tax=Anaerobranca californiensis DSM 14826 TaxID=1120989 RepID=A0A1M6NNJ9_9FIRM|nr:malate dehydrogenase [Anaerobranca californiensis]SHJ97319.1 L-lactate dehydrogenase [Anaerobranca californiensis DSM 14826]
MKISIIGCGRVGTTTAYTLMLKGLAREIVLVDVDEDKAKGEELDLLHGTAELPNVRISSGDFSLISHSDLVIITAGIPRKPGETRLQLAEKNIDIIRGIAEKVLHYAPGALILVVSNPVDIMTYVTQRVIGNEKKVIGLGNVLDQLRFRSLLGKELNIHPQNINAMIIGEHGDSMVILENTITINGLPLSQYKTLDQGVLKEILHNTRYGGAQVIAFKGGTYYSVAIAICQVLEAIIFDTNEILPVSIVQQFEGKEVPYSLPTIIGSTGVIRTIDINLTTTQKGELANSVSAIYSMIKELGI